ncbi:MAG: cysteine desulfurase [Deltaproteobacteria bacterium]|nr:cysteine desulfurase [Deltaproteobacteria bacterium]
MKKIYLDNNATTALDPQVKQAMIEMLEVFGNPSSIHWAGQQAKRYLNESRESIALLLGISEQGLLFTSGGSESVNTALQGVFGASAKRIKVLSSPIEHHATLRCLDFLKTQGAQIEYLSVDACGRIDLAELEEKIDEQTLLVSLLWVNNELGNIYPIEKIGEICRSKGALFHVDGVQGVGKILLSLRGGNIDFFSFSAHKFHGPKGVGGLFIRQGVQLHPLIYGGRQEHSRRAGTENLMGIWGMKRALEIASGESAGRVRSLRDTFEQKLLQKIPHLQINGDLENRLYNTSNILFKEIDGESLLLNLDLQGVAAAAGSACESGSIDPSRVLLALGYSAKEAKASLRFSFSKFNTLEEVEKTVEIIERVVSRLRLQTD